jgi:fructuronate reductase
VRLAPATLDRLAPAVACPRYDRDAQQVGIVHFGIGAFHRAHQAWYTDAAMNAGERDWMITGVSLRSASVAEQMNPQDGLYSLVERSGGGSQTRIIGAVRRVLVASEGAAAVIAALAAPDTHIASFTITEKGYCRATDGSLDLALAGPGSVYRYLAAGLRARKDAGLPGLTLLSCDNLADNGEQLDRLMREYVAQHDPALLDWFAANCTCPATMVDRIVPATTDADRAEVCALLGGIDDDACVITEPFSQWVIEDRFAGPRPHWEQHGAELVTDVRPYETAKLRMLNGAHSLLAYCGLARGYSFVHEAIADPALFALVRQLMLDEAAPTVASAPRLDLPAYADALLERFANPALNHRLIQIAMDGSQKLPQRWLTTLEANRRYGRQCPGILSGLQAWLGHIAGANGPVEDPLAETFATLAKDGNRTDLLAALFGQTGLFAQWWTPDAQDHAALAEGDCRS